MASESRVVGAKLVVGKRVRTTLDNDDLRTESLPDGLHDLKVLSELLTYILVDVDETVIVKSIQQWHVDGVAFAFSFTHVLKIAGTREEVSVSMEADSHHAVRHVEGLFDAVAVMDVNVDVEHTLVILQQFEDSEDNIVRVAESFSFLLFGVVQASCPIDADIRTLVV